ncbi:hypothetical protein LB577_09380 [Mesorhizobium sp. B283B1A]|uniref:hypothetical protein n=1 Tax=Mesorhizobium TaxID=68287 RepID=UPI001CD05576|nr:MULTISPECIES: hypothetical protein [Mesorhizobium]MCA0047167.1 hypothetical protein [Mesorhizobium sp. B283B1A]UQS65304.1 hypothetical protein M5D98_02720 [Mesorhizobium opportunistum]
MAACVNLWKHNKCVVAELPQNSGFDNSCRLDIICIRMNFPALRWKDLSKYQLWKASFREGKA